MNTIPFILIPSQSGGRVVPLSNIIRIQSRDNYSIVFFTKGPPLVVTKLLLWFEDRLPCSMFPRVHRSHMVNKNRITAINGRTGNRKLRLDNGEFISVSRRKQRVLEEKNVE